MSGTRRRPPASGSTLVFESYGVVAAVRCPSAQVLESVPDVLPPEWRPSEAEPDVRFELRHDGAILRDGQEWFHPEVRREEPLLRLAALVRHSLAELAPNHSFIHAGVVAVGGRAVVIPGRSRSGKTTLVRALVDAGALYCSDEYAVVDQHGEILPYPKPLTVRLDGGNRLGVPVAVAPARTARGPLRAGLIVLTTYEPNAEWDPVELSGAEGALALLENTVAARPRPGQSLRAVSAISRGINVLGGVRGEASAAAAAINEWMAKAGWFDASEEGT